MMNIFILDNDIHVSASYHCNKHCVKMILEYGQLLCSAHWASTKNFDVQNKPPWKATHINHPCAKWTRQNLGNYRYVVCLMRALLDEYALRYKKSHKAEAVWKWASENLPTNIDQTLEKTSHVICMSDITCKTSDPVESYRNYYRKHKRNIAKWEPRAKTPDWF